MLFLEAKYKEGEAWTCITELKRYLEISEP